MKRVKVLLTSAVILLAVSGAFASKFRATRVYTRLVDLYPGQAMECQIRGFCDGNGALCTTIVYGVTYQLYTSGCVYSAIGEMVQ
ncbi:hypothetical protein GO495_15630 [Chitinophaga oryziterrae]|uniref:Uncharacterized protein n=1 Tax=Chitinophaga oryziterrae TaxID=1031224 RepID=A0A6N8JD36_9BACT|nr:DUF6520 family protein [Chitinophaga oryziterrae]MVT42022.1 hypothetical protein [Chitinophaga oryziterrae]